jgi:hypothetical protein
MGTAWQMPLAVIGKPTGDGRQFDAGALSHRDLPLPFRYVASDSGGHANAVIVGHIAKIGKEKDGMLPAQGEFYDDDSWPEDVRNAATAAMKFTENKVIGPSVDLDQQEVEHVPEPKAYAAWKKAQAGKLKAAKMAHGGDCGCGSPVMADEAFDGPRLKMIRSGRMASATLVHIPAFAELSGHAKLTPIDSSDPNVDGTTSSAMVAGALVEIDWADVDWDTKIENDAETPTDQEARDAMAALMAGAAPTAPPKDWFDDPKLTGPTPLHIADDGRVYGHVAVWDTCHVGIGDSCVKPPKTLTSYAYFHTGEVKTDDGSRVAVGRLTYGGGHAAPNLGYRAAADHYDRTSATGAYVRAGEDQYGIWVAGMLAPDADESAVFKMRAAPLSGDWRRIGGNLEMVAALHVNTAGFPIPRAMAASAMSGMPEDEEVLSLVAAGVLPRVVDEEPETTFTTAALGPLDTTELGRAIARGMLAEQQEVAARTARSAEWQELLAAATTQDHAADYDMAMGELFSALVE